MIALKKIMLILKLCFLSVFGTSRGLANVEEEIAFITDQKKPNENQDEKPTS